MYLFTYLILFLAVLGIHCCMGFSLVVEHGLLIVVASLVAEHRLQGASVQFSSVAQLCPTLCDPMDCNLPGFPVHHQLLKIAQTHVHRVSDTIQPSHPLLSLSPPPFNLSQHQGLFQ